VYGALAPAAFAAALLSHHGTVTVQPGDTLSALAARWCGSAALYPGLAAASGIRDPDLIVPGERVVLGCHAAPPARLGAVTAGQGHAGRHRAVTARPGATLRDLAARYCGTTADYPGLAAASGVTNPDQISAGQLITISCTTAGPRSAGPVQTTSYTGRHRAARRAATASSGVRVSTAGRTDYEACVIARESGGRSQVMNSSGHYGLYQFSSSTWQAYGGSAASFGNASPAEQRRVFLNAMATPGGRANWSPYDGC
jgi:hypothetical protein